MSVWTSQSYVFRLTHHVQGLLPTLWFRMEWVKEERGGGRGVGCCCFWKMRMATTDDNDYKTVQLYTCITLILKNDKWWTTYSIPRVSNEFM